MVMPRSPLSTVTSDAMVSWPCLQDDGHWRGRRRRTRSCRRPGWRRPMRVPRARTGLRGGLADRRTPVLPCTLPSRIPRMSWPGPGTLLLGRCSVNRDACFGRFPAGRAADTRWPKPVTDWAEASRPVDQRRSCKISFTKLFGAFYFQRFVASRIQLMTVCDVPPHAYLTINFS